MQGMYCTSAGFVWLGLADEVRAGERRLLKACRQLRAGCVGMALRSYGAESELRMTVHDGAVPMLVRTDGGGGARGGGGGL